MSRKPVIAAVLIVRDEARCIARCLDSVRPHVDRILVLDTGSTDGTPLLAAQCGAQVHHLPWPNDFSAARNHALDLVDADWNLVLDADEWIVSGGEQLRRWCRAPRLGQLCVHSAMEGTATGAERRNWLTRLLPRGVRYQGRVHEQPVSPLPRARIELHIRHDGYLAGQLARKRDRNPPLLRRDLRDRPGDPYLLYQLAKDAEIGGDLVEACAHYAAALEASPLEANWRHALVVRQLHCLGRTDRMDTALALADAEMAHYPESPDLFFVLGNLLHDRAQTDPVQALDQWLPLAIGAWERCLAIGERPDLEGSLQGCGSHLVRHNLETARTQMRLLGMQQELARLVA
ncbi:glycosyltransferase family 2 protein [Sphingomonas psychrotolerans]|uniref:Family 2 glycosyl transferase n=1 Tax=Sphingomonas psychrotolerans TaxID=1327635 RepID=A0A2K8MF17_9SPHN|nr:glycosyltransferase family 2 protein [Sphingomonas psychrotolerans]ATY32478.1 family 2 glycosyl transferase [Sphingomonas psychrotolerans]